VDTPETIDLWSAGTGRYHTYRIPALEITATGAVLAFCEGRRDGSGDSGQIDLLMRRSDDGGRTWGRSRVIVSEPGMTCGNPAPVLDRQTGTIWLPFCKNRADGDEALIRTGLAPRTVWVTRSDDDGESWAEPIEITADVKRPGWTWYATGPCHGIQLQSGRLVVPCDFRSLDSVTGEQARYSHVITSDDHGATWQVGGIVDSEGTNESVAVALTDGRVYLNCRDQARRGRRIVAFSDDGGTTFGPARFDEALIEPACQGSAIAVPNWASCHAGHVVFANPASATRDTLTVRLGSPDATTWTAGRVLEAGRAAYCDLAIVPEGTMGDATVLCLFETGEATPYECLRLVRVPVAWLQ
jgi:sialidase-1